MEPRTRESIILHIVFFFGYEIHSLCLIMILPSSIGKAEKRNITVYDFVYLNIYIMVIYNKFLNFHLHQQHPLTTYQHYIPMTNKTFITVITTVYFNYIACSVKLFGKHNCVLITSHEHSKTCLSVNR
jgi:hypothetical protein